MSTVVEHPRFALATTPSPRPPQRRGSREIIDVDALISPDPSRRPGHPLPRRTTEVIEIDSDDEVQITASSSAGPSRRGLPPRRIPFSPPPPNGPFVPPPPVPSVPRRYAGHTALPMRRQPPPYPAGIVRPRSGPLDFQVHSDAVAGPSRHRSTNPAPPAAAPSHHTPTMGLGGALISTHGQGSHEERLPAARGTMRNTSPYSRIPPSTTVRRRQFARRGPPPSDFMRRFMRVDDEDAFELPQINFEAEEHHFLAALHEHREIRRLEKEKYTQSYTHASQAEPGFTFDFAPASDEDESAVRFFPPTSVQDPIIIGDDAPVVGTSSTARDSAASEGTLIALLVCARCSAPLLLNAGLSAEESKDRRVWALRCGHLIDEKCLVEIGQPSPIFQLLEGNNKKGKGKAKAVEQAAYGASASASTSSSSEQSPVAQPEESSIRSRLRSRNPAPRGQAAASAPAASAPPPPPAKKRRLPPKKAKVEARHEWTCPVPSCVRVHASVKIAGVWGPEKEPDGGKLFGNGEARGAIPIFA